jgi:vacuolar-type H+-ATPase subunit D/Vma8
MPNNSQPAEQELESLPTSLEEQHECLDRLLEKYLTTLHEYQHARQTLSKNLSSGYLNLAQANRSATTGRRYGQDYYDERMQAKRRVAVTDENLVAIYDGPQAEEEDKPPDPLRWFGILVPPALRTAQANFVNAVEGPLPQIVNTMSQLRQLEHEISRTRKLIKKLRAG